MSLQPKMTVRTEGVLLGRIGLALLLYTTTELRSYLSILDRYLRVSLSNDLVSETGASEGFHQKV